jgi:predicted transcriptional regulator
MVEQYKQPYTTKRRTSEAMFRETTELKRLPEVLIAMREVNENAFWKVRPPLKRNKKLQTA